MDGTTLTQRDLQLSRKEIDLAWLRESQNRLIAYKSGRLTAIDGQKILSEIESAL